MTRIRYLLSGALISCALAAALPAQAQRTQFFPAQGGQPFLIKPQGGRVQLYDSSAALVVNESSYSGGDTGWIKLPATEGEMDQVRDLLRQQGFDVTRVYDPSAEELDQAMRAFLAKYGDRANARLLFFYSGHGYTDDGMGYIVPVGAGNPKTDRGTFLSKSITLETFQTWVRQFKAKHFMAIFDSCFSGEIFITKSLSGPDDRLTKNPVDRWRFLNNLKDKPVRQFISAGGPDEVLPPKSLFVPAFINGLLGNASSLKDGYVTGKELGVFLAPWVNAASGGQQTPISGVSHDTGFAFGDMIFQYDPSKAGEPDGGRAPESPHPPSQPSLLPPSPSPPPSPSHLPAALPHPPVPSPSRSPTPQSPQQSSPDSLSEECRLFDCTKP